MSKNEYKAFKAQNESHEASYEDEAATKIAQTVVHRGAGETRFQKTIQKTGEERECRPYGPLAQAQETICAGATKRE